MKKKLYCTAAALLAMGLLAGCGAEKEKPLHQMNVDKYVTLGDYANISVSAEPYEVSEEDCNEWLANLYAGYAQENLGTVERAVEMGDTANIDYVGKRNGEAFEGGTAQGTNLTIGSGQFIPGFEEGLVGAMPGETLDLNLTFPEAYDNAELAGQETVFTVTVNYVIPGNEDEMSDEVVLTMDLEEENVSTIPELKAFLRKLMEEDAQYAYETELQDMLLEELLAQSTFEELPEYMVESYKAIMIRNVEKSAAENQVTADAYTAYYYGMTCADFVNTYAEDVVKQDLVLQAIANRENLNVDDEELDKKLQEYAEENGYTNVEEFMGEISREEYRNYFMNEKVFDFLLGNE